MMLTTRRAVLAGLMFAAAAAVSSLLPGPPGLFASRLPDRLTDQEFWRLSTEFSEPGGTFHSDNFVSNEVHFQTVLSALERRVQRNGLYVGVGPEQNFTYIAALQPAMAFIVDIRRGNLHEHLLYKALFEMSVDRADFLARLFVRPRPVTLSRSASPEDLFAALQASESSEPLFREHLAAVIDWLTQRHAFPLDDSDVQGIDYVYRNAFFTGGPGVSYQLNGRSGFGRGRRNTPSYAQLMTLDDGEGRQRSYVASEELFQIVRDLHLRNLIVPVVGDFGGPKALRSVGRYARAHGAVVSALYASNVEQYLRQDGKWEAFCANVASMPLDQASTFIRSVRGGSGPSTGVLHFRSSLGSMEAETRRCA
jgi:hypothetical protein